MSTQVELEPASDDDKLENRAKITNFCLNNGYQFDDSDGETIIVYIPLFKQLLADSQKGGDDAHRN